MIPLEQALAAYALHLRPLPPETVPAAATLGRVLADAVCALHDLPRFDQSAMDGYALRAADLAAASNEAPLTLPIRVRLPAGTYGELPALPAQAAARILTGAPVPPGADTVIPQERAQREDDSLVFTEPYPAHRNIRRRGEELHRSTPIAAAGQRVTPGLLASLIHAGVGQVRVVRRPRLHLLLTGDEIRPAGAVLKPGEVHDSNGPLVRAVLERWGYPAPGVDYVRDNPDAVREALGHALDGAEVVLSAGGASVGDHDFLPAAAEALGVQRVFWKVAQKPGKPLFFGLRGDRVHLAMPGNPGAVLVSLALHLRSVLDCLEGVPQPGPGWHPGRLRETVPRDERRVQLLRMQLDYAADGGVMLQPLQKQDSHMLSNLAAADVLAWIPAGEGRCEAGSLLNWTPLP